MTCLPTLTPTPRWFFFLLTPIPTPHSTAHDQNHRGTSFEEFIFRHGLRVENTDHTPTFQTSLRQSYIDVTLTRGIPDTASSWRVDTHFNRSDHNTVLFDFCTGFELIPATRPWDKANWSVFTSFLSSLDIYIPPSMTTKKLDRLVGKLNTAIEDALDLCCPPQRPP